MRFISVSSILALSVLLLVSAPDRTNAQSLYEPIASLVEKLCNIESLKFGPLISGLYKALQCLQPSPKSATQRSIQELQEETVEARLDISCFNFTEMDMPVADFRAIHNFLWNRGYNEWQDVMKHFYDNGFANGERNIYQIIKDFYGMIGAPQDTIDEIPLVPPTPPPTQATTETTEAATETPNKSAKKKSQPSGFQLLSAIFQARAGCTAEQWEDILNEIIESQGPQWLDLIAFIINAVNNDEYVKALLAKIEEEGKGTEFRDFLYLRGIITLVHNWDSDLKANKFFQALIKTLEKLLEGSITFKGHDINVIRNIIHTIEFLVWGNAFPNPPIKWLGNSEFNVY